MPATQQFATINGKRIAYLEAGSGDPIVLLHGNPTSSYLWRNVIPHLEGLGRVIAPDLIGQGDSEKLPESEGPERYSFQVAFDYLDGLLKHIAADQNVTLVLHDWGSGLGFHWASQNPQAVKGVADSAPGNQGIGRDDNRLGCAHPHPNQTTCHDEGQGADGVAANVVEVAQGEGDSRVTHVPNVEEGRDLTNVQTC